MNREALERLTKPELIDLLLGLQRPDKTSRTSSKPPSTDWKGKREGSRPDGAKPGHKGHVIHHVSSATPRDQDEHIVLRRLPKRRGGSIGHEGELIFRCHSKSIAIIDSNRTLQEAL
jgi:hypothetical protein